MNWLYGLPWRDWIQLEASETAPKEARRRLAGDLREWSLLQFDSSATLVLSEIITNAVVAAKGRATAAGPLPVTLWLLGGPSVVVLLAWDASTDPPVERHALDTDESGRGLTIVSQLSARWGYYYPAEIGGKITWSIINQP
jgi:anti-sigma regulatory factor (Ser/Thr protein kinase)